MSSSQESHSEWIPPRPDRGAADKELSEFLLRICHELRAPSRAIRAHAELLVRELTVPRSADQEQRLAFIAGGVEKIDRLADGLSSYAVALSTDPSRFQPAPMAVLLRVALAKLAKEVRENQAEVTYGELPRVSGDADRLSQLFENLLVNALRHRGAAAPRIHISTERQGKDWVFAVRDNGPGVEAAYLERIFKPFERLQPKEIAGPGLGLAISRAIVERHGGRIWAESAAGGSTMFFTIPAEPEAA
jgi:signal transduction histidine kinase